jgi:Replication protein
LQGGSLGFWFLYLILVHKSTDSKKDPAVLERYKLQGKLVQALENTKYHQHLAAKVQNCHKRFRRKRCEQNHDWAVVDGKSKPCSLRICPHCAHRRSQTLAARTQKLLTGKVGLRYAVLAERNSTSLQAGVKSLWESWTSLRRSVCWRRKVKGCIVALEVTYNPEKKTWHPHLNVLMEGDYFPFEELNKAWIKATGGKGRTSRIQAANEKTVFELLKYTLKVAQRSEHTGEFELILDEPVAIDEFLSAVHGSRLVRSYGTLHGLKLEEEDEEESAEKCPDCGSNCIIDLGGVSHSQLSFDFDKNTFRVVRAPSAADQALHLVRDSPPSRISMNPETIARAVEARRAMRIYERAVSKIFAREVAA